MKKLLLTLGSIAAVAAPVASVVACGAPKQKHIPLDKSVVTKQLPALKSALETAFAGGADSSATGPSVNDGTVVEKDGGFEVTFVIKGDPTDTTGDNLVITIAADGKIKAVTPPDAFKTMIPADFKDQLETLMTAATVDHSGDSIDVSDFDASTLDAGIVAELKTDGTDVPVLATGADHQTIDDYNDATGNYMNAYDKQIGDDAFEAIQGGFRLTITLAEYSVLDIASGTKLDDALMTSIGLPTDVITKLKKLIALGAEVTVGIKSGPADLTGMAGEHSISWTHGGSGAANVEFKS